MAVDSLFHSTETLILASPRKQYPATMVAAHWQLRSMVSCLNVDTIYYPWGRDIYQLNTSSCEREVIATVPFSPRCLVGANGWICCGGENGHFATIKLPNATFDDAPNTVSADPDARLPLDLDPSRRQTPEISLSASPAAWDRGPVTKPTTIGTELVNCITMWFPPRNRPAEAHPRAVCVSANNDKTVTILDLVELTPLETLTFPDSINRAVISPDGRILVAIGDDPFMYVHYRKTAWDKRASVFNDEHDYVWALSGTVRLEGQQSTDPTEMRGSFAAAFSASNRYLAVGTQYGVISVFDVAQLTDPDADPLIVSFRSSKPGHKIGAVRAMEFSRDPLDLLAWTENSGHVGIADVRDNFMSRQILTVDAHDDLIEKVIVSDGVGDLSPFTGLRPSPEHSGARPGSEASGVDNDPRHLRQLSRYFLERQLPRDYLDRHPQPLSPEELEVLEALQVDRRHRDRESGRDADMDMSPGPDRLHRQSSRAADLLNINNRTREIMQSYMLEHGPNRERSGLMPRRRGSVSLSSGLVGAERDRERERERDGSRTSTRLYESGDAGYGQEGSLRRAGASTLASNGNTSNPWAEMEALYSLAVDNPPADPSTRYRLEVEAEDRPYIRRLESIQRTLDRQTPLNVDSATEDRRTIPGGIMGCCWSQDGRRLFVGAADGVYEYHVNVPGRRCFPSITLR